MASANEEGARQAAREVLAELQIASYPIQPDEIAQAKGLVIESRDDFPAGVFGALWRSGNGFGIIVSSACPTEGHRRFTVAHELGHYHIDGHVEQLFASGNEVAPSLSGHFRSQRDPIEAEDGYHVGASPNRTLRELTESCQGLGRSPLRRSDAQRNARCLPTHDQAIASHQRGPTLGPSPPARKAGSALPPQ